MSKRLRLKTSVKIVPFIIHDGRELGVVLQAILREARHGLVRLEGTPSQPSHVIDRVPILVKLLYRRAALKHLVRHDNELLRHENQGLIDGHS